MFVGSEFRKGAEEEGIGPKVFTSHLQQGTALPPEINLSGSKLLVGFASAICLIALVLWALLKLWLFE